MKKLNESFEDSFNNNEKNYADLYDNEDTVLRNESAYNELLNYYYDNDGLCHTDDVICDLKEFFKDKNNNFFYEFKQFLLHEIENYSKNISFSTNYGYNHSQKAIIT